MLDNIRKQIYILKKKWPSRLRVKCTESSYNRASHKRKWDESSGGRFKKAYELLNLRALKFSPLNKIHKISYPYIERYDFYTTLKF